MLEDINLNEDTNTSQSEIYSHFGLYFTLKLDAVNIGMLCSLQGNQQC
jgi:hypothetical protein